MAKGLTGLPSGSQILVTGANGYIGSHIINILLGLGFRVRGVVRSPRPWLNEFFEEKFGAGKFETVVLPNFDDVTSISSHLEGVSGVVHTVCFVSRKR